MRTTSAADGVIEYQTEPVSGLLQNGSPLSTVADERSGWSLKGRADGSIAVAFAKSSFAGVAALAVGAPKRAKAVTSSTSAAVPRPARALPSMIVSLVT